jgi:hypothetical protein
MSGNQSKPVNKFTPGPWAVKVDQLGSPHVVAGERVLFLALQTVGVRGSLAGLPEGEVLANVELAVAAPDLLAALESLLKVFNRYEHGDTLSIKERNAARNAVQAAIAKARGEG